MKQTRKALSIALILCTSRARLRCSGGLRDRRIAVTKTESAERCGSGDTARIRADGGYIPAAAGEK